MSPDAALFQRFRLLASVVHTEGASMASHKFKRTMVEKNLMEQRRQSGFKSGAVDPGKKSSIFPDNFTKNFDFTRNFKKKSIFQAIFKTNSILPGNF